MMKRAFLTLLAATALAAPLLGVASASASAWDNRHSSYARHHEWQRHHWSDWGRHHNYRHRYYSRSYDHRHWR